jgi:hypothetical protein
MAGELVEQAWLLKSKVNPFPVAGELVLRDGRLTFTMGKLAADAVLGWVEEETGQQGLKPRLEAGEQVRVFDFARDEVKVSWPKLYGGSWMQIEATDGGRTWLVSMDYPSGGAITQTMSIFSGRKKGKLWKQALAD